MSAANVTISARKASDKAYILDVQGEINAGAESALMEAYTQACLNGTKTIILNFTKLEYMNSSGIGLLVTLLIRVKRQNQRLLAFGLSDHYKSIFELTRLNEAITIAASEADALTAAK